MSTPTGSRGSLAGANAFLVVAFAAGLIVLIAAAAVGARNAAPDTTDVAQDLTQFDDGSQGTTAPDINVDQLGDDPVVGDSGPQATNRTGGVSSGVVRGRTSRPGSPAGAGGATGGAPEQLPSAPGATREGVHADHFEFGVHAPLTIDGAPLNLAEDPVIGLKGYITFINRQGGVNGRKIRLFVADDRYTTDGGAQSRDRLVKEVKPFFISGTLGVDQIAIVSKAAGEAKIPYMAVGGPEPEWKSIGMFQVGSNYDQYASMLAKYICAQGHSYVGEPVRLGVTTLDSPFIRPVEERFVKTLGQLCGLSVDSKARGYIQKPTQQTSYTSQILDLKSAYDGKGANLVVPLQDPITTSRQVAEMKTQAFRPKWTFSNFAHDSDTTLTLMGKEWAGVRGLSGACYYQAQNALNPAMCANMKVAHEQWVSLGRVTYDENAGACVGGQCEYTYDQASWDKDGSGGATGYQLVHFWLGAMKAIGPDPTREKFVAAMLTYDGYNDLITSPITFRGSANIMRGAEKMVLMEGLQSDKFKQITPGLVDQF